mgnify:CR=1 FL=1
MPARSSEIERKKMSGSQLLVVDDEEVNRDVMYALLSKSGFKVTAAAFGAEAISLASKKRFCSILMDIDMPEMNGFEAARQIRQLGGESSSALIIGMTPRLEQIDTLGSDFEIDVFVGKPFSLPKTIRLLSAAIDNNGRPR